MARTTLPTHPSLRHPLTGEPIQAVWVAPNGRVCWPIMGAAPENEGGSGEGGAGGGGGAGSGEGGGAAQGGPAGKGAEGAGGPKYPANTPPDQMGDAQRAAFYYDQAQKWEGRATKNYATLRDLGATSAEDAANVKSKIAKHDALEHELMSEKDKAVAEAEQAAQAKADDKYRPLLVKTEFRAAAAGRIDKEKLDTILEPLDLKRFLTDSGDVDTKKVAEYVDGVAPAKGNDKQRGPALQRGGASSGGSGGSLTGLSGSELYDRLHPKKSSV